jgi:hypothetical protein
MTLDEALTEKISKIEDGILLKLDVQGFEDRVLRGAKAVLKKTAVCILEISLQDLYKKQANFNELSQLLEQSGFYYAGNLEQVFDPHGFVVYIDAVFFRQKQYEPD